MKTAVKLIIFVVVFTLGFGGFLWVLNRSLPQDSAVVNDGSGENPEVTKEMDASETSLRSGHVENVGTAPDGPQKVRGVVVNERTQRPVTAFTVTLANPRRSFHKEDEIQAQFFSGSKGAFNVSGVLLDKNVYEQAAQGRSHNILYGSTRPEGFYVEYPNAPRIEKNLTSALPRLMIQADGYRDEFVGLWQFPMNNLKIELKPFITVQGTVRGADGQPLKGALVFVEEAPGIGPNSTRHRNFMKGEESSYRFDREKTYMENRRDKDSRAKTDEQGTFQLSSVVEGKTRFLVYADGYQYRMHTTNLSVKNNQVDIALERGGVLRGTISRGNVPVPNAAVSASFDDFFMTAFTDEQGEYVMRGLPYGTAALSFVVDGQSLVPSVSMEGIHRPTDKFSGTDVVIEQGVDAQFDYAVAEPSASLSGYIMASPDEYVEGEVFLTLNTVGDTVTRSVRTGRDGKYRFTNLYPGRYRLEAMIVPVGKSYEKFVPTQRAMGILRPNEDETKDILLYGLLMLNINVSNVPRDQNSLAVLVLPKPTRRELSLDVMGDLFNYTYSEAENDRYNLLFGDAGVSGTSEQVTVSYCGPGEYVVVVMSARRKNSIYDPGEYEGPFGFSNALIMTKDVVLKGSPNLPTKRGQQIIEIDMSF